MSAGAIVINAAIQFGIGMGLHAIGTLLEKDAKQRITVSDDKPPSTSTRGSWIPNVLGRRRIGPYIAWVGDQTTINEQQGSTIVEIVQESAWHIISTGPCDVLHKIYAGGSILFKGNVNRNSHPSGSTVDLGEFGSFNIYWGETNQPINTFLQGTFDPTTGLFDRTGVASRWPNVCYIQWNNFRVGNQSTWPLLEYDIERRPAETKLTNGTTPEISSDPAYFPGTIPASPIFDLGASTGLSIVIATDENGGYIALTDKHYGLPNESDPDGGDFTHIFIRGTKIFMSQPNADPNGYTIKHSTYFPSWYISTTIIRTLEQFSGIIATGTLIANGSSNNDGLNHAHMMHSILFDGEHTGGELNKNNFDIPSLETLAILFNNANENLHGSVIASRGTTVREVLSSLMLDAGVFLVWDPALGKYKFRAIRHTSEVIDIPSQAIVGRPEISKRIAESQVNFPLYTFADRRRNFRDMPITIPDNTVVKRKPLVSKLPTMITYEVAAKVAERRSLEDLLKEGTHIIKMNKGAKRLLPGDVIKNDLFSTNVRIASISIDQLHNNTKITGFNDFYGVAPTVSVIPDAEQGLGSDFGPYQGASPNIDPNP